MNNLKGLHANETAWVLLVIIIVTLLISKWVKKL